MAHMHKRPLAVNTNGHYCVGCIVFSKLSQWYMESWKVEQQVESTRRIECQRTSEAILTFQSHATCCDCMLVCGHVSVIGTGTIKLLLGGWMCSCVQIDNMITALAHAHEEVALPEVIQGVPGSRCPTVLIQSKNRSYLILEQNSRAWIRV